MKISIQRHSCASGSQYYAVVDDTYYGPLTITERSAIESGTILKSVLDKANPKIVCPLRSTKQYQSNTDAIPIQGTRLKDTANVGSTSTGVARPRAIVEKITEKVQLLNKEKGIVRDYPLYTDLLPNPLATNKGPVSSSKLACNYWRRASTNGQKKNQEDLVAKSLTLLRQHLHHKHLSAKTGKKVYLKTSFKERLRLSGITDPDLIESLKQAQENVTSWLTIGAAHNRLDTTVKNYKDLIRKHFDSTSEDEMKAFELVFECALDLLWSWKTGSVFGYLHKYLHARLYTRLNKEKKVTAAHQIKVVSFEEEAGDGGDRTYSS